MQRTSHLLDSIYNKTMGVRIGLLSPDHQSLLLVLPAQPAGKGLRDAHASGESQSRVSHQLSAQLCLAVGLSDPGRWWVGCAMPPRLRTLHTWPVFIQAKSMAE